MAEDWTVGEPAAEVPPSTTTAGLAALAALPPVIFPGPGGPADWLPAHVMPGLLIVCDENTETTEMRPAHAERG